MNTCGDSIRVMHPLFQEDDDGSIPISPLQLEIGRIDIPLAVTLNELWHSRLPKINNQTGKNMAFAAFYKNRFYACAIWGEPVGRMLNGHGLYELRRMAIAEDAPKNTGSRMLKVMRILIRKELPEIKRLISYQDTDVHNGTIYKAAGWVEENKSSVSATGWNTRRRAKMQTTADKIRWGIAL